MEEQKPTSAAMIVVAEHPRTARETLADLSNKPPHQQGDKSRMYKQLQKLRTSAMDTKSIFTFCFVCSHTNAWSSAYGFSTMIIGIFIQTVIPIVITVTRQPILDVDLAPQACPNRGDGITKTIGFVLSLYFIVLTISLCANKLSGLGFLKNFVNLGVRRGMLIDIAIVSQFVGMAGAGGAQFLLFVGNGGKSYVVLLLQSLAMQFCLTVDQRLVSDKIGKYTSGRIAKLTEDELIGDVGITAEDVPDAVAAKLSLLLVSEKVVLLVMASTGLAWCCALAYCI